MLAGVAGGAAGRAIDALVLIGAGGGDLRSVGEERVAHEVQEPADLGEQADNRHA